MAIYISSLSYQQKWQKPSYKKKNGFSNSCNIFANVRNRNFSEIQISVNRSYRLLESEIIYTSIFLVLAGQVHISRQFLKHFLHCIANSKMNFEGNKDSLSIFLQIPNAASLIERLWMYFLKYIPAVTVWS